jgi:hypothetical protein
MQNSIIFACFFRKNCKTKSNKQTIGIFDLKTYLSILFLSLFFSFTGYSQRPKDKSAEIGVFLGCSYYIGDINPLVHFGPMTKPAGGAVFRYNLNPRLAVRANAFFGTIQADDAIASSTAQQRRNLNFRSKISEFSIQAEFNFLEYQLGNERRKFTPYIFAGLGAFKFNPIAIYNNYSFTLQPLGTEGQGLEGGPKKKYKLTQFSIPFGVGIKTHLSKRIGLSLEWGMRKTFTDYLDDVSTTYYDPVELAARRGAVAAAASDPSTGTDPNYSNVGRQRGNPTTKDWYSFAGFVLTLKLKEKRETCPGVN